MEWWHAKKHILCLFPEWFCPPQSDWPSPLTQVTFPLWDERSSDQLDFPVESRNELDAFLDSGSAPIAFTPGSANVFGQEFFRVAAKACELIGRRAIFLSRFQEHIPRPLPKTILYVPFVSLSLLLPRCCGFVHHGGIGSAAQAMAAGIPQLIRPQAHDQFDNAIRIVDLGIGDSLKPISFTPKALARRLKCLIESESIRSRCQALAASMSGKHGISQAVDVIETIEA